PPEALALAAVVVDRGTREAERALLGAALRVGRLAREGAQAQAAGTLGRLVPAGGGLALTWRGPGAHPTRGSLLDEPVAQRERRAAVVLVVVGDLGEKCLGLAVPAFLAQQAVTGVLLDRVARGRDLPRAGLGQVERLDLLEGVRARAPAQRPAHDGKQVDEHGLAQQVVDRLLAHAVPSRDRQQVGPLVRGVVVHVHPGEPRATFGEVVEELPQRLALLGERVRPEGPEGAVRLDEAEEVVEPPAGLVLLARLGVERVALEVEEDVARVRDRERRDGTRVDELKRRWGALGRLELEPGLRAQRGERRGRDPRDGLGAPVELVYR